MNPDKIDLKLDFLYETRNAIKVEGVRGDVVWLDKDDIEYHIGDPIPGVVDVKLTERLAIEKGLV